MFSTLLLKSATPKKYWIQNDGTEVGIANVLVERGVPQQDIVLAYHAPYLRKFTDFAVS